MVKAAVPLELKPMVARPSGFLGELHAGALLDQRQHLALDELRIDARHRVVFLAALGALGVLPAIADLDGDHRRHALLLDQVVEDGGRSFQAVEPPSPSTMNGARVPRT